MVVEDFFVWAHLDPIVVAIGTLASRRQDVNLALRLLPGTRTRLREVKSSFDVNIKSSGYAHTDN
jgi:hypothetical protein